MNAVQRITPVPDEWEEQVRSLIPAYILYEKEYWTGEKTGFCSRCRHLFNGGKKRLESPDDPDVKFRRAVHNDRLICPECGADAVIKARGKFRNMKSLRGNVRAVFCQKITPNHVRLRAFYIEWAFPDYNAVRPDLDFYEDYILDLEPGSAEARRKVPWTADKLAEASARAESAENEAAEAKKLKKDLLKARKEANASDDARQLAEKAKADLLAERDALQTRLDDLEKTPVVEVRELTDEEKAALEDRIRAEIGTETDALRAENEKLKLAADPGLQAFQRYFENFRGAYADMKSLIATMGDEKQRKLFGVLRKTLAAMAEEWS